MYIHTVLKRGARYTVTRIAPLQEGREERAMAAQIEFPLQDFHRPLVRNRRRYLRAGSPEAQRLFAFMRAAAQ